MKRKLFLIGAFLLLLFLVGISQAQNITWYKGGYAQERGQKLYDWYWGSPAQELPSGNVGMGVKLYWTDAGRRSHDINPRVKFTLYTTAYNIERNQYLHYSVDHFDFNNEHVYTSDPFPFGREWKDAKPGSMAEVWIEKAAEAPRVKFDAPLI